MEKRNHRADFHIVLIGATLVLLVGVYFIGRSIWFYHVQKQEALKKTAEQDKKDTPLISPLVLREKLRNQEAYTLIDIRQAEEYAAEHIPQALSLPGGNFGSFQPDGDTKIIVIYSTADQASFAVAKETLRKKKFSYFFLEGGFENWKQGSNQTLSVGDPNSFVDQSKVSFIPAAELKSLIEANDKTLFILDVQSEADYQKKHIRGAKNIPLSDIEKRAKEIPPAKRVVVYGRNELASFQGGVRLFDLNIFSTSTLEGNATLTAASGLPLEP